MTTFPFLSFFLYLWSEIIFGDSFRSTWHSSWHAAAPMSRKLVQGITETGGLKRLIDGQAAVTATMHRWRTNERP